MKKIIFFIFSFSCCIYSKAQHTNTSNQKNHSIIIDSVLQTTNYTYLLGKENNTSSWLAVPTVQAEIGKTYYYIGGMAMNNFTSKELKRTFDLVMFLGGLSEEPLDENGNTKQDPYSGINHQQHSDKPYQRTTPKETKIDEKIAPIADGITIQQLFTNKEIYSGKTVKIKAKVTKYNEAIMNKNWAHVQDGTDFEGKFELVVTTLATVKVGDIVTFEGTVVLNKDFGYGYKFDLFIENAIVK